MQWKLLVRFVNSHIARLGRKLELCCLLSKVTQANEGTLSLALYGMMSLFHGYESSACSRVNGYSGCDGVQAATTVL